MIYPPVRTHVETASRRVEIRSLARRDPIAFSYRCIDRSALYWTTKTRLQYSPARLKNPSRLAIPDRPARSSGYQHSPLVLDWPVVWFIPIVRKLRICTAICPVLSTHSSPLHSEGMIGPIPGRRWDPNSGLQDQTRLLDGTHTLIGRGISLRHEVI